MADSVSENWWTIKDAKGVWLVQTVGLHLGRNQACKAAADKAGVPWKNLAADGLRAIRLRVSEVKNAQR